MKSTSLHLAGLLLVVIAISAGAQSKTPAQRFAGTWNAQFQGKTFTTLKLAAKDDQLTGSMTGANINLDKVGNLTSAEQSGSESEISDAKLAGDTLSFATKDQDSGETINWKMKIKSNSEGELLLVIPEPHMGIPTPRPWKITRESPHP